MKITFFARIKCSLCKPNQSTYVFTVFVLQIMKIVGFDGSFKEFINKSRTNKRFYDDKKVATIC